MTSALSPRWIAAVLTCLSLGLLAPQAHAANALRDYDIPSEDAAAALRHFSDISGHEVLYVASAVSGVTTRPVHGKYAAGAALLALLEGTPLQALQDLQTGGFSVQLRESAAKLKPGTSFPTMGPSSGQNGKTSSVRTATGKPAGSDVVTLSPFEVSAQNQGYVASDTTSGAKVKTKIFDLPASMTVITGDFIRDTGAVDPWQALELGTPGVSMYGDNNVFAGIMIRGFRAQFWAIDGATIASTGPSNNYNLEGIEVVKGPSALLYGPFGAYGGYVNLMPKWAHRNMVSAFSTEIGTDDYTSNMLDIGNTWLHNGRLQTRLVFGYLHYNRPGIDGDYLHSLTVAPSVTYEISDRIKVRFRAEWDRRNYLSSNLPVGSNGRPLRQMSANKWFPGGGIEDHELQTQTEVLGELSDEWSFKFQFLTQATQHNERTAGYSGGSYGPGGNVTIYKFKQKFGSKSWYMDFTSNWKKEDILPGVSNDLVVSPNINNWDEVYYNYYRSDFSWLYPQYNQAPWTTFSLANPPSISSIDRITLDQNYAYYPYVQQWLGGIVANDTLSLLDGKLKLIGGVRYNYDERYSYFLTQGAPNAGMSGSPSPSKINTVWLHRYGAVYQPVKHLGVYFGHDEGYLAAGAIFKYDGSPVESETGKNNEFGIKFDGLNVLGGTFYGSLAYFQLSVNNKWREDPYHIGFYVTDGHQENNGYDFQIAYNSNNDRLSVLAGYYIADGPTDINGLRAVQVPKTTANVWLRYNLTKQLAIGGGWRHQGDSLDATRQFTSPSFATYDAFVSYRHVLKRIPGVITYRLGVSNITDVNVASVVINPTFAYPIDGRQAKLTATYNW